MKLTKTEQTIQAFEKRVQELLKGNLNPTKKEVEKAVAQAYKEYPVMEVLRRDIHAEGAEAMERGYEQEIPSAVTKRTIESAWARDGLTLSERTTHARQVILYMVGKTVMTAVKDGIGVRKLAKELFDGYGYGGKIPVQDLPDYLKTLTECAKKLDGNDKGFQMLLRRAKQQIELNNDGHLKASYNGIIKALEVRNEKHLEKAIYVATQERTRYYAERIARTELARAYQDGFLAKYEEDDDCIAFRWTLNSRHPVYDICNLYAEADLYGMGKGIFPKDKVPDLPVHPHCMCHLRPVFVGSSLIKGKEQNRMEEGGREWLKSQTKHQRELILGIEGAKAVSQGVSWTEKARGYNAEPMKSRLHK